MLVHLGEGAPWARRRDAADGELYRAPADAEDPPVESVAWVEGRTGIRLRYGDGTEFHVRADAREIWGTWPPPLTVEDGASYLLGPVLGYVLRRLGVLSLHASAVVVRGRAIVFSGPMGAGKSTIAAAFAAAGHAPLSDDVVALRESGEETLAYPAYDYLRVWEESARMLVPDTTVLPRLTPNWDKLAFPLEALGYDVARAPAPLAFVCLLEDRSTDDRAPFIEPVGAAASLVRLAAHSSSNYLLDPSMRSEEFASLARLLARTPVHRLVPHADPARLPLLVARVAALVRG